MLRDIVFSCMVGTLMGLISMQNWKTSTNITSGVLTAIFVFGGLRLLAWIEGGPTFSY